MHRTFLGPTLAVSGWIALAATALPAADPLRVLLLTVFLVLCPGGAAVRLVGLRRERAPVRPAAAVLTVALSLSLDTVVAEGFYLSRSYTTVGALATLAALTTLMALLRYRWPRPADAAAADARPRPGPGRRARRRAGPALLVLGLLAAAGCAGGPPAARPATQPSAPQPSAPPADSSTVPAAPGNWHVVFQDDFTGTALDPALWTTCYDWNLNGCTNAGNHESEWYLPGQVAVGGGRLSLTAVRRATPGSDGTTYPWTSGMVSTGRDSWFGTPRRTFTGGYFAASIQVPGDPGTFPAFWLMPDTRTTPPELDIAEFTGDASSVQMTVHWAGPGGADAHAQQRYGPVDFPAGFHVFAVDWEKTSLTWYVDGVVRNRVTENVPDVPMELLLNLAVGYPSAPAPTLQSAVMRVGWVRVWQH